MYCSATPTRCCMASTLAAASESTTIRLLKTGRSTGGSSLGKNTQRADLSYYANNQRHIRSGSLYGRCTGGLTVGELSKRATVFLILLLDQLRKSLS